MLDRIKQQLPDFAKDMRLNLSKILDLTQMDGLTEQQIMGAALAVAYHVSNKELIEVFSELINDEKIVEAAKLATSIDGNDECLLSFCSSE